MGLGRAHLPTRMRPAPWQGSKSAFLSGRQPNIVCSISAVMSRVYGAPRSWGNTCLSLLIGALAACLAQRAEASNIRGRLVGFEHLRNPVWAAAKDPERHGYSFREPVMTVPAAMRKLFPAISKEICVVAIASGNVSSPRPVSVRVSGGRTTPVTLVVAPGTELRFKNADPFDHRLFGVGFTTFAASTMAKGATRRWTPLEPGRYELRDELAPSLSMWVIAQPAVAAVAYPTMDGKFSLAVDEPGQYQLQAYFAGEPVGRPLSVVVERRDVDVSGRPLAVASKPPVEDNNP
jgi:hypothetical protein